MEAPQPRFIRQAIALAYRKRNTDPHKLSNSTLGSALTGEAQGHWDEPFCNIALG